MVDEGLTLVSGSRFLHVVGGGIAGLGLGLDDVHGSIVVVEYGLGLGGRGQFEELRGQAGVALCFDGTEDLGLEALVVRFARAGTGALGHFCLLLLFYDLEE